MYFVEGAHGIPWGGPLGSHGGVHGIPGWALGDPLALGDPGPWEPIGPLALGGPGPWGPKPRSCDHRACSIKCNKGLMTITHTLLAIF